MTKQAAFPVETAELPEITADDLRGWDREAVDLVLEYQQYGWTGRFSSNHHAIMRAPDGEATASIARRHSWNRGGKNARRPLKQWLDRQAAERDKKRQRNSFGLTAQEVNPSKFRQTESDLPPWQLATTQTYDALLRMKKLTRSWWETVKAAGSGNTMWQLTEDGEDNWAIVSAFRSEKIARIVAVGPAADPEDIEDLQAQVDRLNQPEENDPMIDTGPPTKWKYPCPEPGCDRGFDLPGALALHAESHVPEGFPCLLCDDVLRSSSARGSHLRGKKHKDDPRLPHVLKMIRSDKTPRTESATYKRKPPRPCEYCGEVMPALSIGGHQRGHKALGHLKIAEGGDGATQVIGKAKAIAARETPVKVPEAVTEAPVKPEPVPEPKPEPLAVAKINVIEAPVVNGTGHVTTAEERLKQVLTIVSPELVGDLEREKAKNKKLERDLAEMTADRDELQTMFDMIEERRKRVSVRAQS